MFRFQLLPKTDGFEIDVAHKCHHTCTLPALSAAVCEELKVHMQPQD
jgi:hypothetical protein